MEQKTLFEAIKSGNLEQCRLALGGGADINEKAGEIWGPGSEELTGGTALMMASWEGCLEIAKLLIDSGADVNAKNKKEMTPLYVAIYQNKNDIAKLLINSGANINEPNDWGYITALILASSHEDVDLIKLLLAKGANVNAKEINNLTALHAAARNDRTEIAKLLLDAGADANAESDGLSPLDMAFEKGHREVINLFKNRGLIAKTSGAGKPIVAWKVKEHWLDWSVASPQKENYRKQIQNLKEQLKSDIIANGDIPWGSWIVFKSKINADKIATLLTRSGCQDVTLQQVCVCYSAEDAYSSEIIVRKGKVWICKEKPEILQSDNIQNGDKSCKPQTPSPKFCSHCGSAIGLGANFCCTCGRRLAQ